MVGDCAHAWLAMAQDITIAMDRQNAGLAAEQAKSGTSTSNHQASPVLAYQLWRVYEVA